MLPDTRAMFVPCTVTQRLNVFQMLLFRMYCPVTSPATCQWNG